MTIWRNIAKRVPQFSLGSLFVVMTCCAVGMMVGTSPPEDWEPLLAGFNFHVPRLNWAYASLAMATCFVIVELWRQQRSLSVEIRKHATVKAEQAFRWSLLARKVIAISLAMLLGCVILTQYRIWELRDHDEFLLLIDEIFPQVTWYAFYFVGLSVASPRQASISKGKWSASIAEMVVWIGGAALLSYVVTQTYLVAFLVHIATDGIYKSLALRSQNVDVFPAHAREGWLTFYLSLTAVLALVIAAKCLVLLLHRRRRERTTIILASVLVIMLASCVVYCAWFYVWEYHRVSPFLADTAGLPAMARDWIGASLIVFVVTIALARSWNSDSALSSSNPDQDISVRIRASGTLALATVPTLISAGLMVIETARMALSISFFGSPSIIDVFEYIFADPILLLQIAAGLLALQIAWRWLRHGAPEIVIQPIEPRRVFWAWLGLVALVIVGVPVIAAFGFCWWLGPWYLW